MFEAWRQDDGEFAFWGTGDFEAVRKNCEYYGVSFTEPEALYDFQAAFSHVLGYEGQQAALWRGTEWLNIPDSFTFHNALNDAVYTALVGVWLGAEARYIRPKNPAARPKPKYCEAPFKAKKGKRLGPTATGAEAINLRVSRQHPCPICGKTMWVRAWYTVDDLRYFGSLVCEEHGKFIARLTYDGATGLSRVAIPELSQQLQWEYAAVKRRGELILCKAAPRRRRRAVKGS